MVTDKGRLVQTGVHTELIEFAGPYRQMWELQNSRDGRDERFIAAEAMWASLDGGMK